jgi:hypothetical protein
MEKPVGFARAFYFCAAGLRVRDRVASLKLAPQEDIEEQEGVVAALTDNVSVYYAETKKELLRKDIPDDVLRIIGGDPYGFCLVLKEMKDEERWYLIWNLFDLSISEIDSISDPENGFRKRYLGILKGIMYFCHVVPPEPEEIIMGGEKISFYNWDELRAQVRASGKA